ncbi:hypothetical protein KCU79_g103, partial [Aureobasidium melanogenum]
MGNSNSTPEASGTPRSSTATGDCIICCEENMQLSSLSCGHPGRKTLALPALFAVWKSLYRISNLCSRPISTRKCLTESMSSGRLPLPSASTVLTQTAHTSSLHLLHRLQEVVVNAPADESLQEAIRVATENGGKPCPRCKEILYRGQGCAHFKHNCGHEWCFLCSRDWDDCKGSCEASHADVQRVQRELDEQEMAENLFEVAGRPTVLTVLANMHVNLIMDREYIARINHADFIDAHQRIAAVLQDIRDLNAPITPRAFLAILQVSRQLFTHEFETANLPFDDAYNANQEVIEALLTGLRVFRSQEFIAFEREVERTLFAIYGDNEPDANELRDEIRETLDDFETI